MSENNEAVARYNQIRNDRIFDIRALITAYHFPAKPQFEPCFEQYEFSQILFVTAGTGVYVTEQGQHHFGPGMMFYRPAGQRSMYVWDEGEVSYALISFVCPSPAMESFVRAPFLLCEEERSTLLDLTRTCARICESVGHGEGMLGMRLRADVPVAVLNFVYASLERFLIMVYCRLNRIGILVDEEQKVSRSIDDSELVGQICRCLAENLGEMLTVGALCERFGVSPTALMKKFRAATGMGVNEYFADLKIREAKRLIRSSNQSFAEIAERLGYSSAGYFSKVFKAHTGQTPTEYSRYASKRRVRAQEN